MEEIVMKNILLKNCWVGSYVGDGNYEGGSCPDILITEVPEDVSEKSLVEMYIMVQCGDTDYDKISYDIKEYKTQPKNVNPVVLPHKHLVREYKADLISVSYENLHKWYIEELKDKDPFSLDWDVE
jgi:hypothetical protein